MNIFWIILLCCSIACFGQEKVTLKNGEVIVIYPNKTWEFESEIKTTNLDSNAIIVDLNDSWSSTVYKYPILFYSQELKSFQKNNVELVCYSNGNFIIKSSSGQIGYVSKLGLDNSSEYIRTLERKAIQQAKSEGKKIYIKGIGVDDINSAGGVDFFIDWGYFDYSKDIKYISFTVVAYNNVADIQKCSIGGHSRFTGKATGPISASDEFNPSNSGVPFKWGTAWYNNSITCIKLTKVVVNYMDGSSYTYVNELPKILANEYINSCK